MRESLIVESAMKRRKALDQVEADIGFAGIYTACALGLERNPSSIIIDTESLSLAHKLGYALVEPFMRMLVIAGGGSRIALADSVGHHHLSGLVSFGGEEPRLVELNSYALHPTINGAPIRVNIENLEYYLSLRPTYGRIFAIDNQLSKPADLEDLVRWRPVVAELLAHPI